MPGPSAPRNAPGLPRVDEEGDAWEGAVSDMDEYDEDMMDQQVPGDDGAV